MTLLTPLACSAFTSSVRYSTGSRKTSSLAGEAISGVSVVVAPRIADLLAADVEYEVVAGERAEGLVARRVDTAGEHRELRGRDELRERVGAEVELVVAVGHGVETDQVHHLGLGLHLVGGEEQRALEGVAGVSTSTFRRRP